MYEAKHRHFYHILCELMVLYKIMRHKDCRFAILKVHIDLTFNFQDLFKI